MRPALRKAARAGGGGLFYYHALALLQVLSRLSTASVSLPEGSVAGSRSGMRRGPNGDLERCVKSRISLNLAAPRSALLPRDLDELRDFVGAERVRGTERDRVGSGRRVGVGRILARTRV